MDTHGAAKANRQHTGNTRKGTAVFTLTLDLVASNVERDPEGFYSFSIRTRTGITSHGDTPNRCPMAVTTGGKSARRGKPKTFAATICGRLADVMSGFPNGTLTGKPKPRG